MTTQILIPQLGNEITEAELSQWLVDDGAAVAAGDAILSISTTKMAMDIEAPVSGTLRILLSEGELAPVGAVVGEIV
jgi:pyruvate/2-oxoglutarate dehydrogenase complex dihydrolipoamide acyltransferase (E2) component